MLIHSHKGAAVVGYERGHGAWALPTAWANKTQGIPRSHTPTKIKDAKPLRRTPAAGAGSALGLITPGLLDRNPAGCAEKGHAPFRCCPCVRHLMQAC